MVKTYGLAIETKHGLNPLRLPLMTFEQAEQARSVLLWQSKAPLHVVNIKTLAEVI